MPVIASDSIEPHTNVCTTIIKPSILYSFYLSVDVANNDESLILSAQWAQLTFVFQRIIALGSCRRLAEGEREAVGRVEVSRVPVHFDFNTSNR